MSVDLPLVGIPIKPFGVAKQRLHSRLSPAQRSALGKAVAAHTIDVVLAASAEVVVITGDPGVADWASGLGVATIAEGPPGSGLNGAASSLRDTALGTGTAWLVLHADLPRVCVADVTALLNPLGSGAVVAPSYDGGTTALGSRAHADFKFGPASFHRHMRAMPNATVVVRPGLAMDLDTVADLEAAANSSDWIRAALDSPGEEYLLGDP